MITSPSTRRRARRKHIPIRPAASSAWKIAYADFITAMMSFFLLLWLLNSEPSEKLKMIAKYLEPSLNVLSHDTKSVTQNTFMAEPELKKETLPFTDGQMSQTLSIAEGYGIDPRVSQKVISDQILNDNMLQSLGANIEVQQLQDGVEIMLTEKGRVEMFTAGGTELKPLAKQILRRVVELIKDSSNFIAISGYTARLQEGPDEQQDKLELSIARANATRKFMLANGLTADRVAAVKGYGDSSPLMQYDSRDPRNRRIVITLLEQSIMPSYKLPATRDMISLEREERRTKKLLQD